MRSARARSIGYVLLLVAAVALAGCQTSGMDFHEPGAVTDLRPDELTHVGLPVVVSWKSGPLPAGQRYLVLVDQLPMAPGQSVKELTDDVCKRTPGCPDVAYMQQHYIFLARRNRVKVPSVPTNGPFPVDEFRYLHEATIVIVDARHVRVGESFWSTSFYIAIS
jgi:hypothetical protein